LIDAIDDAAIPDKFDEINDKLDYYLSTSYPFFK